MPTTSHDGQRLVSHSMRCNPAVGHLCRSGPRARTRHRARAHGPGPCQRLRRAQAQPDPARYRRGSPRPSSDVRTRRRARRSWTGSRAEIHPAWAFRKARATRSGSCAGCAKMREDPLLLACLSSKDHENSLGYHARGSTDVSSADGRNRVDVVVPQVAIRRGRSVSDHGVRTA